MSFIFPYDFDALTGKNRDSAEDAITGVDGGHHIRLRCWYDAAMMYNTLYLQGNIVLVNV